MIISKTPREIEIMRHAGKIVALTHAELQKYISQG
ncbi:MAG: type I methionyl aminopeptidase, partial [Anaerobacillus sp.]